MITRLLRLRQDIAHWLLAADTEQGASAWPHVLRYDLDELARRVDTLEQTTTNLTELADLRAYVDELYAHPSRWG